MWVFIWVYLSYGSIIKGCTGWSFGVHFSILARKLREKSLHRHWAIKWRVYKVWHLFFACPALLLGFHVKKNNNFVIKGGSTFMETYCPWLYLLTSSLWFTVWLQFNQFLWQVHFVMPEIFSVITIKMCCLKRILIPDESESRAVLRKSDSRWVKISSLNSVPMANFFWQGCLFLSAALADIQSASFSIL